MAAAGTYAWSRHWHCPPAKALVVSSGTATSPKPLPFTPQSLRAAQRLRSSADISSSATHSQWRRSPCAMHASHMPEPATSSSGIAAASGSSPGVVRRLVLLRHAASDDGNYRVKDHERTISAQGKRQAMGIANKLKELGWLPDLIVASNARRTQQTLEHMGSAVGHFGDVDVHFFGSLYTVAALDGQTRSHLQECLQDLVVDAHNVCVMCVGHNRGWEEAASSFAGQAVSLRTASAALLQCDTADWAEALKDECKWDLVDVVTP